MPFHVTYAHAWVGLCGAQGSDDFHEAHLGLKLSSHFTHILSHQRDVDMRGLLFVLQLEEFRVVLLLEVNTVP